ncbi:SecDF P1 head subdomain-containing protein [Parasphingorhabdus marina]|uniref:SecDF P1 head subdomain-containing protein n=1 Tax=Parasphingorhabdus marina TaxID=394732 RepID=UPI0009413D97|nr:hypothetical protein [Parasphingorhabdus marina]
MIATLLLLATASDAHQPANTAVCQSQNVLKHELRLSPEDIESAELGNHSGRPVIYLLFSEIGNQRFMTIQKGRIGKSIALCFKGKLISEPVLREYLYGGSVQISGGFTIEEAEKLTVGLRGQKKKR